VVELPKNPFDFVNHILTGKPEISREFVAGLADDEYPMDLINAALMQYNDTLHQASLCNSKSLPLSPLMHFDLLSVSVVKKRRPFLGKWAKKEDAPPSLGAVAEMFNINTKTAARYLEVVSLENRELIIKEAMLKYEQGVKT
jgi:hypothetical protein